MGVIALLGIPRAVVPEELPRPRVLRPLLVSQLAQERTLVQSAFAGLPRPVRAVGELVRRLGRAEADSDLDAATRLTEELRDATRDAAEQAGGAPLLQLRALQTHLFFRALGEYRATGNPGGDLTELSGNLLSRFHERGWVRGRPLEFDDETLAALFKVRWTRLTALQEAAAFQPTTNDWRLYYGARLKTAAGRSSRTQRLNEQLSLIRALGQVDPTYPTDYASGIVLFQLNAPEQALDSFRAHLRKHPDGAWSMRARNYATASAERLLQP